MASDHQQHTQVTSQLTVGPQQQAPIHSSQLSSVNNSSSTQLHCQQPQLTSSSLDHHPVSTASSAASQPASGLQDQPQQQFCLRWNNFQSNIVSSFETLLNHEELVDVTLSAEGKCVRAHKVLLSACSPYFRELFQALPPQQHPVVVLRDTRFTELKCLLCFIYHGEVNVSQENLSYLLSLAESLKVKGLAQESTKRHGSKEYEYSAGAIYTPEREDEPSDDTDAPLGRQKYSRTASPPQIGLSNLSALGSLLSSAASERIQNDVNGRNIRQQPHSSSSSSLPNYERSTPHQHHGRNTPSHHLHERNNSSQPQQRLHSPSAKKRKRQSSPGAQSSSGSSIGLANSQNSNQHGSSSSPPLNNTTANSLSPDEDHPSHAVNLSVCPSTSPPPRLMVLKQELISNDEESSNGDKERLERLEQRERLCNLFEKERISGMIKLGGFIDSDLEGEEEPPPPHEDDHSGDMDSHGGGPLGLHHPLSSSLHQSFVPSFSATSHSAAAAAAAAAAHHFANSFPPGSSGTTSGSSPANWRSHTSDQNPNSPQGGHPVFNELLCGGTGGVASNSGTGGGGSSGGGGSGGGSVSKKAVPTPCPICNKVLSNAYNMRVHLETHQDITYKCLICGIVTRTRDTMRKHLSNVHKLRNVQLKNSFKKITGKTGSPGSTPGGSTEAFTPPKCSKSPPPLLTPTQAIAAKAALKTAVTLEQQLQAVKKEGTKSHLKSALTSGLTLTSSHIPATSLGVDLTPSIASMTSAAINDVTAAAVACLFPGLTSSGTISTSNDSPPPTSQTSLFSSTSLLEGSSDSGAQGNKLASIVSKLSQKQ